MEKMGATLSSSARPSLLVLGDKSQNSADSCLTTGSGNYQDAEVADEDGASETRAFADNLDTRILLEVGSLGAKADNDGTTTVLEDVDVLLARGGGNKDDENSSTCSSPLVDGDVKNHDVEAEEGKKKSRARTKKRQKSRSCCAITTAVIVLLLAVMLVCQYGEANNWGFPFPTDNYSKELKTKEDFNRVEEYDGQEVGAVGQDSLLEGRSQPQHTFTTFSSSDEQAGTHGSSSTANISRSRTRQKGSERPYDKARRTQWASQLTKNLNFEQNIPESVLPEADREQFDFIIGNIAKSRLVWRSESGWAFVAQKEGIIVEKRDEDEGGQEAVAGAQQASSSSSAYAADVPVILEENEAVLQAQEEEQQEQQGLPEDASTKTRSATRYRHTLWLVFRGTTTVKDWYYDIINADPDTAIPVLNIHDDAEQDDASPVTEVLGVGHGFGRKLGTLVGNMVNGKGVVFGKWKEGSSDDGRAFYNREARTAAATFRDASSSDPHRVESSADDENDGSLDVLTVLQHYMQAKAIEKFDNIAIVGHSLGGACAMLVHSFAWPSQDLPGHGNVCNGRPHRTRDPFSTVESRRQDEFLALRGTPDGRERDDHENASLVGEENQVVDADGVEDQDPPAQTEHQQPPVRPTAITSASTSGTGLGGVYQPADELSFFDAICYLERLWGRVLRVDDNDVVLVEQHRTAHELKTMKRKHVEKFQTFAFEPAPPFQLKNKDLTSSEVNRWISLVETDRSSFLWQNLASWWDRDRSIRSSSQQPPYGLTVFVYGNDPVPRLTKQLPFLSKLGSYVLPRSFFGGLRCNLLHPPVHEVYFLAKNRWNALNWGVPSSLVDENGDMTGGHLFRLLGASLSSSGSTESANPNPSSWARLFDPVQLLFGHHFFNVLHHVEAFHITVAKMNSINLLST
ncbi:unnamed protein product [Amoebophrya sp. A25]|nr:unnamed protein product [Amoebophrya sp. A25]|eukprot:GSA25T00004711001.1